MSTENKQNNGTIELPKPKSLYQRDVTGIFQRITKDTDRLTYEYTDANGNTVSLPQSYTGHFIDAETKREVRWNWKAVWTDDTHTDTAPWSNYSPDVYEALLGGAIVHCYYTRETYLGKDNRYHEVTRPHIDIVTGDEEETF